MPTYMFSTRGEDGRFLSRKGAALRDPVNARLYEQAEQGRGDDPTNPIIEGSSRYGIIEYLRMPWGPEKKWVVRDYTAEEKAYDAEDSRRICQGLPTQYEEWENKEREKRLRESRKQREKEERKRAKECECSGSFFGGLLLGAVFFGH